MTGYICQYCNKASGTTKDAVTKKEKPSLSEKNCPKSPDGKHKWIKK